MYVPGITIQWKSTLRGRCFICMLRYPYCIVQAIQYNIAFTLLESLFLLYYVARRQTPMYAVLEPVSLTKKCSHPNKRVRVCRNSLGRYHIIYFHHNGDDSSTVYSLTFATEPPLR